MAKKPAYSRRPENGGAPTKYSPKMCEQVNPLALLGLSNSEIAKALGICPGTFEVWIKEHKELNQKLLEGRELADGRVAAAMYKRALGYKTSAQKAFVDRNGVEHIVTITEEVPPSLDAAKFILTNRQGQRWSNGNGPEVNNNIVFVSNDPDKGDDVDTDSTDEDDQP